MWTVHGLMEYTVVCILCLSPQLVCSLSLSFQNRVVFSHSIAVCSTVKLSNLQNIVQDVPLEVSILMLALKARLLFAITTSHHDMLSCISKNSKGHIILVFEIVERVVSLSRL